MGSKNVIHIHNGILFSTKKYEICRKIDRICKYTEGGNPASERQILQCYFSYENLHFQVLDFHFQFEVPVEPRKLAADSVVEGHSWRIVVELLGYESAVGEYG